MKQFSLFLLLVVVGFLFLSQNNHAQMDDQPLLVTSFNRVAMDEVATVNKLVDSVFAPVLKQLVDEQMIMGWGQFNHAWGDEWNVNFWYIAKDMASFEKFWDEYVSRVRKKHPTALASVTKHFAAHKDNIYTIRNQYPNPPQK